MTSSQHEKADRLRALHQAPGFFVIANAWDAGSARILAGLGFPALAFVRLDVLLPSSARSTPPATSAADRDARDPTQQEGGGGDYRL